MSVRDAWLGLVLFAGMAAFAVAGCASKPSPGWTYAPPPSPTPAASAGPVATGSAPASAPVTSSVVPAGEALRIAAKDIRFDLGELRAPAGTPFSIVFDNQEPVPHNVAIYVDSSGGTPLFQGDIFSGPGTRTYAVPALQAGRYFFRCDVHPTLMTGTLVVP